jgi:Anti-sigma factor NepR
MPAGFRRAEREREGGLMAKDEKVPNNEQCEEGKLPADRPRKRGQEALPGILGKQLRAAYGELLNAPVPDAITDLIKRLEAQEAAAASGPEAPAKPLREEQGQ